MALSRPARLWRVVLETVSPLGWTVAAVGAVAWALGVYWGWHELLVVAGIVVVLFAIAAGLTIGRLQLSSEVQVAPARVVVGERAVGELTLRNEGRRTVRGLRVELPVGEAVAVYSVARLHSREAVDELFVVPTHRRAVIPVGPMSTIQGDPLGLLRRTRQWSNVEEIFVHPKTVPLPTLAAGLIRDMEGQPIDKLSPSDIAFHTLREYVVGDDHRHIHWKSSAKLNKLMVRQYVDTRRSDVAVALSTDLDEYHSEDEFELAVSYAASVALQALRSDQTLSVIAGGARLPSTNAKAMLDRFSGVEGAPEKGGADVCMRAVRTMAVNATIVVLCTGARPTTADLRQAATRLPAATWTVVVRPAAIDKARYRTIGTSTFVDVPALPLLGRTLEAAAK